VDLQTGPYEKFDTLLMAEKFQGNPQTFCSRSGADGTPKFHTVFEIITKIWKFLDLILSIYKNFLHAKFVDAESVT